MVRVRKGNRQMLSLINFNTGLMWFSGSGIATQSFVWFASYIEPGLRWTHYLESLINIGCFTALSLFSGFIVSRIREKLRQTFKGKPQGNPPRSGT